MQAKDVPERPVLEFLESLGGRWATWFDARRAYDHDGNPRFTEHFENSVLRAMPEGTPEKVALAKMRALIKRGLADGCPCGCRGDFELTAKGREVLREGKDG